MNYISYSYSQVVALLENFASSHLQIKRFGHDFPEQIQNYATSGSTFPFMYASPVDSSYAINTTRHKFRIYILDIIEKNRTNVTPILNVTNLTLEDLKHYLGEENDETPVIMLGEPVAQPLNNFGLDYLAGYYMDIEVEIDSHSVCEIPFLVSPIISGFTCDIEYTNDYLTCSDLPLCPTIIDIEADIAALSASTSGSTTGYTTYEKYYNGSMSSGIISGGTLSINSGDASKFDLAAGKGVIVDNWTDLNNPVVYELTWGNLTGNSTTYLSSSTQSHISIDKNLTIQQFPIEETNSQRRDLIMLGQLGHSDNTTIKNVNAQFTVFQSPVEQYRDLVSQIKLINNGNIISPNGANLLINRSSGTIFGQGINFSTDNTNPNQRAFSGSTGITFQYRTQTGGTFANTTLIDPLYYDLNGVRTVISGNKATNQRIYMIPNGNIRIQYGQTVYNNLASALQSEQNESFIVYDNLAESAILIGILSVQSNCTDLTDTTKARFILVSKFGENIGGSAGLSTTTLQQAYDNSVTPEITTNATLGGLSIINGAGADTLNIFEGLNSASTITSFIQGDGDASFNNINVVGRLYNSPVTGGTITSATTIDWSLSNYFDYILSANTTFSFSNSRNGQIIMVGVTQGSSSYTLSWPTGTTYWAAGTAPVQTTTTGKTDVYTLVKINNKIYGSAVQNF